jgi:hypothetical protein
MHPAGERDHLPRPPSQSDKLLERNAGAVELGAYGPADRTSYMLACYVKDVVLSFCSILVITAFLAVAAPIYNYVAGPGLLVVAAGI